MEEAIAQPEKLYFSPSNYTKGCRIMRQCDIAKVLNTLELHLNEMELEWFKEQNQFMHLFHMPRERTRKLMGMWMLILRTIKLQKRKEWWFYVNGVPIRYSIREHALISGKVYLENHNELGGFGFVMRQFQLKDRIFLEEVESKLKTMVASEDRLRMAGLYLLSSVIKMKAKVPLAIEPFLLRIVDDLDVCKAFPWGRYSFEHCSEELCKLLTALEGEVKDKLTFTFPTITAHDFCDSVRFQQ